MVCCKGDNILILKYLSEVFQAEGEKLITFFSESDNAVWLEYETWLGMINKKDLQEELSYFHLSSFPFDTYDVFSNFKNSYQFARGIVSRRFEYHVVLSLVNEELLYMDSVEKLAAQFLEKAAELTSKYPSSFEVVIRLHAAYNVFGDNKFSSISNTNQIQQFINLFYDVNTAYLTVDPNIYVTGTDARSLAQTLFQRRKPGYQYIGNKFQMVPFSTPVSLSELVTASPRLTYQLQESPNDAKKQQLLKSCFEKYAKLKEPDQLLKQIYRYIG